MLHLPTTTHERRAKDGRSTMPLDEPDRLDRMESVACRRIAHAIQCDCHCFRQQKLRDVKRVHHLTAPTTTNATKQIAAAANAMDRARVTLAAVETLKA